ncbi:hypothetical protein [Candidatus Gromoviella agglomerans]|uniref:hypothetical protein n=1 Tax=Candidatus Gromoviella agglomerans TaxID=2806609 RepID=UPI001E5A0B6C|nr:hypothetical protein [Candidatus Gromoviella agglomerans]UFX98434.1 hypothetical protein Gromo_00339 [Candidatus Gromoviella agglomerans]
MLLWISCVILCAAILINISSLNKATNVLHKIILLDYVSVLIVSIIVIIECIFENELYIMVSLILLVISFLTTYILVSNTRKK